MIVARRPAPLRSRLRPAPATPAEDASPRWSWEWIYFSFIIGAWCFTPFIRRLIDYRNGAFNPVQITSLLPFAMLIPLALVCFKKERLARLSPPFRVLAWVWLGTFAYGFLIAFAQGNVSAAVFAMVEYLVPTLAGIWLAGQELSVTECIKRLARVVLPCAGIVAVYGLFQWIDPPPWDVMWVQGSDFLTVGEPIPFAMRIFSTLNSPGPAGDFCVLTMLLVLPSLRLRSVWMWALLSALGGALLLTLVREAWVGLVVGVGVFLALSPKRLATAPLLGAYAVLIILLVSTLPTLLGASQSADIITSRISTLADIGHDESALDRQQEIDSALAQGLSNPIGSGLGVLGSASKLGANPSAVIGNILDSGYLTRLIELGWLGTIGYMIVVIGGPLVLAYRLFRAKSEASMSAKVAGAAALAMCAALAWGDAADEAHLGLQGFFFWIALGLCSLAIAPGPVTAPEPGRSRLTRSVR